MSELYAPGLVTIYSTPKARRTLDDGRVVELLHDTQQAHVGIDGSFRGIGLSDANSPRLHRDGHIYFTSGSQLARFGVDSDPQSGEVVHDFGAPVSIGGGHGDFDRTQRYLPIIVAGDPGVYDLQTGDWWAQDIGAAVGDCQVGNWDVCAVGGASGAILVYRDGTRFQIAGAPGHEDVGINPANGNPVLFMVTAGWSLADFQRWNVPESQSVVGIDMVTQQLVYQHDTGNHGSGWWGLHVAAAGSRVAVSAYNPTSWVEVHDLAAATVSAYTLSSWAEIRGIVTGTVSPRFGEGPGAGTNNYWGQRKAALSEDASTVYWTDSGNTWIENIGAPAPPDPDPGGGMDIDTMEQLLSKTGRTVIRMAGAPPSGGTNATLVTTDIDGETVVYEFDRDTGEFLDFDTQ